MRARTIGRALGIGLRVAARIAGRSMASATATARPAGGQDALAGRRAGQSAGATSRNLARGAGGFPRSLRRVGRIVWLEIAGVFFLLPALAFAPTLWRLRASYAQGPDRGKFLVAAGVMAVFLYLSVSSFSRARKK